MNRDISAIVRQMTLEEKAGLCSGRDFWHLKGAERLGVPAVMVCDGPHGLRKQEEAGDHLGINESIKAVCFPPACLTACSFDRDLVYEMGEAIGREAQATDVSVVLGPGANIKRSPLCGRNFEYYSEDPYLAGEIASAFIKGVQSQNVGTSLKHFAANSQEFNRMSSSSEVDERTLREIYLPAFETAVKDAKPYTVMCSYNRVNGVFASENKWLLSDVLRDEWGFDGYVVSDWGAVNRRVPGLEAGLDLEMPASGGDTDRDIVEAVKNGALDEAVLDRAVERILNVMYRYLDRRMPQTLDLDGDHEIARRVAEGSIVLLKNEDAVLPLKPEQKVCVIGGFAKAPRYQGGGSSHINSSRVDCAWDVLAREGVVYTEGFPADADRYDEGKAREAVELAKGADVAVVFAGLPDSFESEGYDRSHMNLPACQDRVINEILGVQPNVVVVLHNGSPVEMPWLDRVKGVVEAYLGGQAGGGAVASVLTGKVNPSGKLAETMPLQVRDNPSYLCFGDGKKVEYREGVFVGYRYYDAKDMPVAFPFGHGLSYTTFAYSDLRTDKAGMNDTDELTVTIDVVNTGSVAGAEVVQLYVRDKTNAARRPEKELKGFTKVFLQPGERQTVSFTLSKRAFAWYNVDMHDWYAATGDYEILIGASSRDIRAVAGVHITCTNLPPLDIDMNSTLGELMGDERTRAFALDAKRKLNALLGTSALSDSDEGDLMGDAMAVCMPLRNLATFGVMPRAELIARIAEFNAK